MRKIFGKIMIIFMVVTMINIPTMLTFAAITEVTPNVHYDASDMFDSVIAETAGFTMSSGQKNIYLEFGDNVFGVPEEQPDGDWFLAEKTKKKDWNINDGTQTLTVNVDSPGDYSVYLLAREYGNRGFSVTMSGEKIDGSHYEDTYLTNDRYANPATNVCGQSSIIGSSVADGSSLCIHYAQFNNLAVGTHSLEISYGGDSGKSVGNFYGLNVYQTKVYQEPCVTITSAENVGDAFEYTLDVPESVIENDYNYFIALKDRDGILCEAKYKEPQGKFENVDGKDYTLVVYTWTKQMEPIGMDTMIGYTKLDISADKDIDISPDLIGLFYEDLSFAGDGGLYAEQIENRSFEHQMVYGDGNIVSDVVREPEYAWSSGKGSVEYKTDLPLNDKNTYYAQISGGASGASISNKAYEGVYVEQGKEYKFSVWARKGSYSGDISVAVGNSIQGKLNLENGSERADGWAKYSATLPASSTISKAKYTISFDTLASEQSVDIDMVSMFPGDAIDGVYRKDMVEAMKDVSPKFLRFPGGCAVEGYDLRNVYRWKNTVGPIEERQQTWNRWANKNGTYNETFGLGFYEYFKLCEYLDCKPLPILSVGIACQFNTSEAVPVFEADGKTYTTEFMSYVQDAIDLIEFANGSVDTTWGKLRAEMGHPEPFNLEMIGIGNEQWETANVQWFARYEAFEKFIHEAYPDIKLINSAGPDVSSSKYTTAWTWARKNAFTNPSFAYAMDEHNYNTKEWLFENDNFYDEYNRNVNVYIGEYAAKGYTSDDGVKRSNDLISALSEAAFLTGIERNSDIVKMASYAPLFSRSRPYSQWGPDMIFFNDTSLYKTPNYFVQKMCSNNMGDYTLKTEISQPTNQRIYQTTSYDESAKEIIVKLVNPSDVDQLVVMNIDASFNLTGKMTTNLLTSNLATDFNDFDNTNKVVDKTYTQDNILTNESENAIDVTLAPYSYTILRLQVK